MPASTQKLGAVANPDHPSEEKAEIADPWSSLQSQPSLVGNS